MQAPTAHRPLDLDRSAARTAGGGDIESLSRIFEEQLDALRQVDRALSQIERHITDARGDPHLQAFWRGVERDFAAEAHRIALRVGAAAIGLFRIKPWPARGGAILQAARHLMN